ncbi:MAG TPA: agmatine deiminase family protein [Pirellulales bacterium]|jgi:agmatine deiminase|nr:agmatine deiminase family protein [Pirellulales bacterium]
MNVSSGLSPLAPAALGYRMPAEWEPHAATWLSWPHKLASWPGKFEPIPALYARLVRTLAAAEKVCVLAGGHAKAQAKVMLAGAPNVELYDIPTDDAWLRDSGPTFLVGPPSAPPALVDWGYNAWGGKYPPYENDDVIPRLIARQLGHVCYKPRIIFEGGAIDTDGRGTFLTTEQCLLNPNRNPQLSRADIERYLAGYLGARKVLWLGGGIVGDDTDGHIDELARFVAPKTVVAAVEEDPKDENYEPLKDNLARLKSLTDADGAPLEVIPLPMPRPLSYEAQRLPASYCNFYIANGLVIVPQFGDPTDGRAVEVLAKLFPDRRICPLPAIDLVWGLGAFHCITQQQPALA